MTQEAFAQGCHAVTVGAHVADIRDVVPLAADGLQDTARRDVVTHELAYACRRSKRYLRGKKRRLRFPFVYEHGGVGRCVCVCTGGSLSTVP